MQKRFFFIIFFFSVFHLLIGQNDPIIKIKKFKSIDSAIVFGEKQLKKHESDVDKTLYLELALAVSSRYNTKSRFADAKTLINKGLSLIKDNRYNKQKIYLIMQLANNFKLEGNTPEALRNYLLVHDMFLRLKDSTGILRSNIELAEYYRKVGNYQEAERYLSRGLDLVRTINKDTTVLIRLYGRGAAIKNEQAQLDSSIFLSKKVLLLAQSIRDSLAIAQSLNELGFTYKNKLKLDSSELLYMQAEKIYKAYGDNYNLIHVMNNRAMLYSHNNYPKKQIDEIHFEIIQLVENKQIEYDLSQIYIDLYTQEIINKDSAKALVYFKKYHEAMLKAIKQKKDEEITKIKEQYDNIGIRKEMEFVSEKLNLSQNNLEQKKLQNKFIIIALIILLILVSIIGLLWVRIRNVNKELISKNKQKDALIQEVHHRVKNNLQVIIAMLKMQLNTIEGEANKVYLKETSRRINAMSLVHEMLYNKDASEFIVLKEYIIELTEKLKQLILDKNKPVILELNLNPEIKFNISNSVAIGMITSEVISNAMKYAFQEVKEPKITISLDYSIDKKNIIYSIQDNGPGMSDKNKKEGLGTRLIDIFARQIESEYSLQNLNGLEYKFKIPLI